MNSDEGQITSMRHCRLRLALLRIPAGQLHRALSGRARGRQAGGQSTAHLKIIDADYHGGKKAICQAECTATCDGGFKPLDCASYPFFPAPPGADEVDLLIKGRKCPLQAGHLWAHAALVRELWNEAAATNPEITAWLNKVELVGYREPLRPPGPAGPRVREYQGRHKLRRVE